MKFWARSRILPSGVTERPDGGGHLPGHEPAFTRLDPKDAGWAPCTKSDNEWLQVTFAAEEVSLVTAIETSGVAGLGVVRSYRVRGRRGGCPWPAPRRLAGRRRGSRARARGAQVEYKSGCSDPWSTARADVDGVPTETFPGPSGSGDDVETVAVAKVYGDGILARYVRFTQLAVGADEAQYLRCAIRAAPPHAARASAGRAPNALRSCADQRRRARAGLRWTGQTRSPSRSGSRG